MKNWYLLVMVSLLVVGGVYWFKQQKPAPEAPSAQTTLTQPATQQGGVMDTDKSASESSVQNQGGEEPATANRVQLTTSRGTITLELFGQQAPGTVQNFLTKAQSGFYQGLTFHRVEDWVIQGGDPFGNGTGGGTMPTELSDVPFERGSLGVARGGNIAVSNDAQFFICTKDCGWLTGQYTIFGKVVDGIEVVDQIRVGDKILGMQAIE